MTNREIFDSAVHLASELRQVGENADYETRAPYLLPLFCARYVALDATYRRAHGLAQQSAEVGVRLEATGEFPLSPIFAAPAAAALAALLVVAENPQLCDRLEQRSREAILEISRSIPCLTHPITSVYG